MPASYMRDERTLSIVYISCLRMPLDSCVSFFFPFYFSINPDYYLEKLWALLNHSRAKTSLFQSLTCSPALKYSNQRMYFSLAVRWYRHTYTNMSSAWWTSGLLHLEVFKFLNWRSLVSSSVKSNYLRDPSIYPTIFTISSSDFSVIWFFLIWMSMAYHAKYFWEIESSPLS